MTSWRFLDASSLNSVSFIQGLVEDVVTADLYVTASGGTGDYIIGIMLNSATLVATIYGSFGSFTAPFVVNYKGTIGLGFNNLAAAERQITTTAAASIFGVVGGEQVQGFRVMLRM